MQMSEFIARLDGSDQDLVDRLSKCKKPEEAYAIAQEYGVEASLDEFIQEMTRFKKALDELNEEDLAGVAGGADSSSVENTLELTMASVISGSVAATV